MGGEEGPCVSGFYLESAVVDERALYTKMNVSNTGKLMIVKTISPSPLAFLRFGLRLCLSLTKLPTYPIIKSVPFLPLLCVLCGEGLGFGVAFVFQITNLPTYPITKFSLPPYLAQLPNLLAHGVPA